VRPALAILMLVACDDSSVSTGVILVVAEDGTAPAWGESPWPSDANRELAGLRDFVPHMSEALAAHQAALDGFGLRPTVQFFLDGDLDPTSLDEGGFLVDVDPASPERGRTVPLDWRWDAEARIAAGATPEGTVLREGTRYAAVLTRETRDAAGRALRGAPSLAAAPARWATTAEAQAELEARWDLAGLTVLTTQHAVGPLLAARALLDDTARVAPPVFAVPDPAFVFTEAELDALFGVAERDGAGLERLGWSNPTGMAHDHVGAVATGTITIARFRRDDTGDDTPTDETFELDAAGAPILQAVEPIPITFILPEGAPPADGWPVAIIGHGLGSSRHAMLSFAEPLTRAGFALVAIDFEGFGSRRSPADALNNSAGAIGNFNGDPSLPDGFGDATGMATALAFLEEFRNFSATRDSVRQSVLDLGRVVQLLRADSGLAALAPLLAMAPRLDARRIAYLGESYGSLVGSVFAGVEPEVGLFVLDVPGGGMLDLEIVASPTMASLAIPFAIAVYGFNGRMDRYHPAVSLVQGIVDAADPLTYASRVLDGTLPPRHILFIEVMGDELIPNTATDALGRVMGLALLEPYSQAVDGLPTIASPASANVNGQTAVVAQYSPATHGANWTSEKGELVFVPGFPHEGEDPFPRLPEPIPITNPLYETLDQVVQALQTYQLGAPIIVSTHVPAPP
jgi:hypothetical protein